MSSMSSFLRTACVAAAAVAAACASENHQTVATEAVESSTRPYEGTKSVLALGMIQNRSPYMTGMFSDGVDRLGGQAKTIVKTHLSQSGRFLVVDRDNMDEIAKEALIAGTEQDLTGARFVVTGEVTEFGRRETGDRELFGILGRAKTQVAYSKVSLNVVDVRTSQVVYSVQGAGEYSLSDREIVGFGSTSSYDATLNGKVLNLSIMDAVNKLVAGVEAGAWTSPGKP
jgi:curli biogenesis system outer membrane secretion channel CsgG